MKISAIGDIHFKKSGNEELKAIFREMEKESDLVVLAGDLTDTGLPEEMEALLACVEKTQKPLVAVIGNHDHENDKAEELTRMMVAKGVQVLDGNSYQVDEIGFTGVKGFCGGFGDRIIQPFGERMIKEFVHEGIEESLRLGKGLAQLSAKRKIAVLHYSPVEETLTGESRDIYPFLGTSWLADALDRYGANLAIHSHAHNGSPEGRTRQNIPVYNVSRFVLMRVSQRPYRIFEL